MRATPGRDHRPSSSLGGGSRRAAGPHAPARQARRLTAPLRLLTTRPQQRNAITTAVSQPLCLRATDSPADGYYEWQRTPASGKTPHFLRPRDRGVLAFAGLYKLWCDPARPPADPTAWLWTTTIRTTAAIPRLAHLHDRMPVTVAPARYAWLGPGRTDPAAAAASNPASSSATTGARRAPAGSTRPSTAGPATPAPPVPG